MERRFPSADAKDAALYRSMRKKGTIESIELYFADPADEHRLWVPDQILGAYGESLTGSRSSGSWADEWAKLSGSVSIIEVRP